APPQERHAEGNRGGDGGAPGRCADSAVPLLGVSVEESHTHAGRHSSKGAGDEGWLEQGEACRRAERLGPCGKGPRPQEEKAGPSVARASHGKDAVAATPIGSVAADDRALR